ncbi:hypothetical protein MUK42_12396, partial [Musa troglodytarum]
SHEELIYSWQIGPWCERSHELVSGISSHKEDMSFSHLQDSSTIGLWSSNKRPRHKSPGKKPTNPCAWLKDHHPCCPFLEHLILTIESTLKENDGFDDWRRQIPHSVFDEDARKDCTSSVGRTCRMMEWHSGEGWSLTTAPSLHVNAFMHSCGDYLHANCMRSPKVSLHRDVTNKDHHILLIIRDEKSDGQTVFWAMQTSSSSDKSRNKVQKFTVFSANTCTIIDTKRQ